MKYIKIYELFNNETLKRGDIFSSDYTSNIYLVLEDMKNCEDNMIPVFVIGNFQRNFSNKSYANLIFNTSKKELIIRRRINNNSSYKVLNSVEKSLYFKSLGEPIYQRYINIVKDVTGIDLKDSDEYKDYLIKKSTKKYNI